MESSSRERVVFSEDGARLAVCSLDGEVKVWDSATGTLSTRFTPEGARGVAVAAASWSRCIHKHRRAGRKILLAVGTKVIVWNDAKGRQERALSGVHTRPVTDVAWGPANVCVYSASEDKQVAVWNVGTWGVTHTWLADRHGVKCICCHSDRDILATAGRTIKIWNSKDYSLIKKFTGHATSVCGLAFIGDGLLLSCACDDRILNLWSSEAKNSTAVASFTCEDEVMSCYVTVAMGTVHAVALALEGMMHIFKYPLTNQIAAPISAHSTLQFTTAATEHQTTSPLPVLAVCPTPDGITVAHSSPLKPCIETLRWSECVGGRVCLERDKVGGLLLPGHGDQRISSKAKGRSVTVLGPGHMSMATDGTSSRPKQLAEEAPLSSRLLAAGVATGEKSRVVTAASLGRLLAQAVQSGDRALLEEPLKVRKEVIIRQTIRRLPVALVVPLLKQLIQLLETSPGRGLELSLWVRHVLTQHSSYLLTQPQLVSTLSSFYQVLEVRSSVYNKLCRIHGKLDLMNIHEPSKAYSGEIVTEALVSATIGDEVIGNGESSDQGEDAELSENQLDQSDVSSDVDMDTEEHKHQHFT